MKKGSQTATLPKIISCINKDTYVIEEFVLDVDSAVENSVKADKALIAPRTRLKAMDEELLLTIMGQCTDSCRGGTLFALMKAQTDLKLPGMAENHLVGSCRLHNLQTTLRNAIQEVFSEGAIDEEN